MEPQAVKENIKSQVQKKTREEYGQESLLKRDINERQAGVNREQEGLGGQESPDEDTGEESTLQFQGPQNRRQGKVVAAFQHAWQVHE